MLDYRANKLYWFLFFIPIKLTSIFAIFILPFLVYFVGYNFAENKIFQIISCFIAFIIIEFIFSMLVLFIANIFQRFFNTLVDIIPHDGRSKEEALAVVWNGEKAIKTISLDKVNPRDWSDQQVENFIGISSLLIRSFYPGKLRKRVEIIQDYYKENLNEEFNQYKMESIFREKGIYPSFVEQLIVAGYGPRLIFGYGLMVFLIIFNPINL
jgi:hypothetical protein